MVRNAIRAAIAAIAVAVVAAPAAHADPDYSPGVVSYVAHYGGVVCDVLDDYPSFSGIIGVARGIQEDGFTAYQAGEVIGLSVTEICPWHTGLVMRFAHAYGGGQYT
jgi:hypothetical protein